MCSFSISKLTDHHDAHNLSGEGNANHAMTSQSKATLMLLFITACWGLTFILIKNTVQSITPFTFVALRFLLAVLILGWVFKYGFRIEMKPTRDEWKFGSLLGVFLFIGYSSQTAGMLYTSAGNAGFITALSVVLVPVLARIYGGRISGFTLFGVLLSVAGVGLLSLEQTSKINSGDALEVICAIFFAMHIFYVGRFSNRYHTGRMTCIQVLVCGVLAALSALLFEHPVSAIQGLSRFGWGSLLFCAIIATSFAYYVQNEFQKHTDPVKTALVFTTEPVFSSVFAFVIAGETLSRQGMLGGALMILAMLVAEFGALWSQKLTRHKPL